MTPYASLKRMTFNMPFTIIVGIAIGGLLVPVATSFTEWAAERYDSAFPVIAMTGTLLSIGDNEAVITLQGRKLRKCAYLRTHAYALDADGDMHDAYITRIDMPETGTTRPIGDFQSGMWRVWPLPNSRGIVVYMNHLCGARVVVTRGADIDLTRGVVK